MLLSDDYDKGPLLLPERAASLEALRSQSPLLLAHQSEQSVTFKAIAHPDGSLYQQVFRLVDSDGRLQARRNIFGSIED